MAINVRQKGQRAEREAIKLLQPVIDTVYAEVGQEPPMLERNQQQTNKGGYDIIGLPWLALEIKHQKVLKIEAWWEQTLRQAKGKQMPVLMYKQNNGKWRVRINQQVGQRNIPVEISVGDFLLHFEELVHWSCWENNHGNT